MSVESGLKAYAGRVDVRLASLLPPAEGATSQLHEAMRYSALAPGKRLRPALCMACAEAVGGSSESALDAACAIEMVHCFSLIHDDLPAIDNDDLRRGRPTCHKAFGESMAILAGDALFALAFETIGNLSASSGVVESCSLELARASGICGLVGGEALDILSEGGPPNAELLEEIHRRKTGALFVAACGIGGLLGGGASSKIDCLRAYGASLGLAFQIADDILNETSTAEQLGKAVGSDREHRKQTYPALHGLERSCQLAREASEHAVSVLRSQGLDSGMLVGLARYSVERVS